MANKTIEELLKAGTQQMALPAPAAEYDPVKSFAQEITAYVTKVMITSAEAMELLMKVDVSLAILTSQKVIKLAEEKVEAGLREFLQVERYEKNVGEEVKK